MSDSITQRSAFITGATGCIGSALALTLAKDGWQVVALVRDRTRASFLNDVPNVRIVEGELADRRRIVEAMKGCQIVFHLAAKVHSTPDIPAEQFFRVNVEGTRNTVAAAIENRVDRFVFFSTVAVYPESDQLIDESIAADPVTAYGASKLEAEAIVLATGELKATVLRLPVVYGPRDRGNVTKLIEAIKRGHYFIVGDGRNLKSMVAVENVVDAALLVAGDDRAIGQVFIVSDRQPYAQSEIAAMIAEMVGRKRPVSFPRWLLLLAGQAADVINKLTGANLPISSDRIRKLSSNTLFSAAKIERELGFKPRITLREGLAAMIGEESRRV